MSKRRVTIELTDRDQANLRVIQEETGDTSIVGPIRLSLRELAGAIKREAQRDAGRLECARRTASNMIPLDEFMQEFNN